jgi:hypothetical protein
VNPRVLIFVLVFTAMLISPRLVEPAYYGFLVAFLALVGLQGQWNGYATNLHVHPGPTTVLGACVAMVIIAVVLKNGPDPRDLFRDCGAIFAFLVGRYFFVAYQEKGLQTEVLLGLSAMGVVVAIVTIFAAMLALAAGVSAYIWRGEYVPWGHNWLPFAIVANFYLIALDPARTKTYQMRIALCVFGTLASLSRTDLLLEFGFAAVLMYRYRRQLFYRVAGFTKLLVVIGVFAAMLPFLLRLQVVQQRVERGVGDNDESLGWRFMENLALLDHFLKGTVYDWLFGFGLGARMPLPPGVVDFNNNTSIPHLHNSFGTLALKFGVMGLVVLGWYLWRLAKQSRALKWLPGEPHRAAGRWIVLLCLGKAMTLQALSEWSQLVFFGIGCMLMLSKPLRAYHLALAPDAKATSAFPGSSAR